MKKHILITGLVTGVMLAGVMVYSVSQCYRDADFKGSKLAGYTGMILIFSLIFIAVKVYRDKQNDSVITFWQAFKMGAWISLIGSSIYVITWLFYYYLFIPDFLVKYTDFVLRESKASGATAAELSAKAQEMANFSDMYKNPVVVVLMTYMEVLPIGLMMSLLSALVLNHRRKQSQFAGDNN